MEHTQVEHSRLIKLVSYLMIDILDSLNIVQGLPFEVLDKSNDVRDMLTEIEDLERFYDGLNLNKLCDKVTPNF